MNNILRNKNQSLKAWSISIILCFFAISIFAFKFFYQKNLFVVSNQPLTESLPKVLGINTKFLAQTIPLDQQNFFEVKEDDLPKLAQIKARSFLVYELNSNRNILEKNISEKLPIASLTKLMTGLVAYEKLSFTAFDEIKNNLTNTKPSAGLKKGFQYKIEDIFNSMIIGSANDASQALAEMVEKNTNEKITNLMNSYAHKLNMNSTHFSNPAGFDSAYNFSTAEDLKILVSQTQKIFAFSSLGKRQFFKFADNKNNIYKINSTNKLLAKYPEISSIKTGYTENSLGSIIIKENIHGQDIIFIVLGSQNREADMEKLREIVFNSSK